MGTTAVTGTQRSNPESNTTPPATPVTADTIAASKATKVKSRIRPVKVGLLNDAE